MAGRPKVRAERLAAKLVQDGTCLHDDDVTSCRKCLTVLVNGGNPAERKAAAKLLEGGKAVTSRVRSPRSKPSQSVPEGYEVVVRNGKPHLRKKSEPKARRGTPERRMTVTDALRQQQEILQALIELAKRDPKLAAAKAADLGMKLPDRKGLDHRGAKLQQTANDDKARTRAIMRNLRKDEADDKPLTKADRAAAAAKLREAFGDRVHENSPR